MYRSAMVLGAIIIGGVIFLAMFPSMRTGMSIDTTGWIPLFATMVRFLPYVLIVFIVLWFLAKSRRGN
jgi:hypothetical protein